MDECKPLAGGAHHGGGAGQGEAVQIEPMKSKLKPPRSKLLKLENEQLLTNFAFE